MPDRLSDSAKLPRADCADQSGGLPASWRTHAAQSQEAYSGGWRGATGTTLGQNSSKLSFNYEFLALNNKKKVINFPSKFRKKFRKHFLGFSFLCLLKRRNGQAVVPHAFNPSRDSELETSLGFRPSSRREGGEEGRGGERGKGEQLS